MIRSAILCLLPASVASASTFTYTLIQVPGAQYTQAFGINNNGDIVGDYVDAAGVHGFERTAAGNILPLEYGSQPTVPLSINDQGQIVGFYGQFPFINAFFLDTNGSYTTEPGGELTGITDNGLRTGFTRAGLQDFVVDASGNYTYFTAAPPYSPPPNNSFAWGINEAGIVVGSFIGTAFIRAPSGTLTWFTASNASTVATGINDEGSIVGYLETSAPDIGGESGFVRSASGTFQYINYPGANGTQINGINDSGEMVGETAVNGKLTGLLIDPISVPEPAGFWAMLTGIVALGDSLSRRGAVHGPAELPQHFPRVP